MPIANALYAGGKLLNKDDLTIIYYTSNKENEDFEKKIQNIIKKTVGDIRIISVSQKPINFGDNICVGEVSANDHNLYRQIQIACKEAKTPFVASAEADNLYPPDYIKLKPDKIDTIYRYNNIWILKYWRTYFVRKRWCEGAQIAGREYYLDLLEKEFENKPMWTTQTSTKTNPFKKYGNNILFYGTDIPVISMKTGQGLRSNTITDNAQYTRYLPYWGSVKTVRRKLCL